jgi:hypothetical protein
MSGSLALFGRSISKVAYLCLSGTDGVIQGPIDTTNETTSSMNTNDLAAIVNGEPAEAMEAAKRIIRQYPVNPVAFIAFATNKTMRLRTRTAAIWLPGFIDDDGRSLPDMERIRQDRNEAEQIRDYAAEAILHIRPHRTKYSVHDKIPDIR